MDDFPKESMFALNGWRAEDMTAVIFEKMCRAHGLECLTQELVNWHGHLLTDCFSTFARKGSKWSRPNRVFTNSNFHLEQKQVFRLSALYSRESYGPELRPLYNWLAYEVRAVMKSSPAASLPKNREELEKLVRDIVFHRGCDLLDFEIQTIMDSLGKIT